MPTIQILYQQPDHKARADALMNALAHAAKSDDVDITPVAITGLDTLIFWGHGGAGKLCDKTPDEIVRLIQAWKSLNDGLKTIEIITCNSRHYDDIDVMTKPKVQWQSKLAHKISGKRVNLSIAKQIKRGLKYNADSRVHKLKVWSTPESSGGAYNQYSILLWDLATTSWCYVVGPTEEEMFEVTLNIKNTKAVPIIDPTSPWGVPRTGSFTVKLAAAKIDFPKADYSDVVAGQVTFVRHLLVKVD